MDKNKGQPTKTKLESYNSEVSMTVEGNVVIKETIVQEKEFTKNNYLSMIKQTKDQKDNYEYFTSDKYQQDVDNQKKIAEEKVDEVQDLLTKISVLEAEVQKEQQIESALEMTRRNLDNKTFLKTIWDSYDEEIKNAVLNKLDSEQRTKLLKTKSKRS